MKNSATDLPPDPSAPANSSSGAIAFFDLDGTLTRTNVVSFYARFRLDHMPGILRFIWLPLFLIKVLYYVWLEKKSRVRFLEVFYQNYRGLSVQGVEAWANKKGLRMFLKQEFPQGREEALRHIREGNRVVLLTGTIMPLALAYARNLGVTDVIAMDLESRDGAYTGRLIGNPISSEEKARVVAEMGASEGVSLTDCHAYGDSISDLPVLAEVGHPVAVNPDSRLRAEAEERGWPVEQWSL